MSEPQARAAKLLGGEEFSFTEAIGGWRGLIETALPGIVYVAVVTFTKTWQAPTIAALAVVAILVTIRLIQRAPLTQALSGVVGVAIGAIWAWRTGNATSFYGWGLITNALYLVGLLISMAVRWPVAGIVMGLVHGTGSAWRSQPGAMRRAQLGTAVLAIMFGLRLLVQVPLYLADQAAVLGTVKLVMGTPLFALTLWVTWLIVRNVGRKPEPQDPPQQP
ncbi:DUF3159 domain-containing protein [Demequina sp.]|uniref:DUF3159 domain-containing protein n=1 Tax=Demequina sp. TaxID=2050685 RepID=UPI003D0AB57C